MSTKAKGEVVEVCTLEEGDPKYWEYRVSPDGEMCKYYPYTGAYYGLTSKHIVFNDGGRVDFDGSALATKRHADRREAIRAGLIEAALQEGIGNTPTEMLSEIVKMQSLQALQQTRDGTSAAKWVWGLVGYEEEKKGAAATVTVELDADSVAQILQKLANPDE